MSTQESAYAAESTLPSVASKHALMCFVCSRCEYPICTASDVILEPVDGGTTKFAFRYDLDCLLDMDDTENRGKMVEEESEDTQSRAGVPCYSGDETVLTSVCVSREILDVPLAPAARLLALESVVESHTQMQVQQKSILSRFYPQHGCDTGDGVRVSGDPGGPPGARDRDGQETRDAHASAQPRTPLSSAQGISHRASTPSLGDNSSNAATPTEHRHTPVIGDVFEPAPRSRDSVGPHIVTEESRTEVGQAPSTSTSVDGFESTFARLTSLVSSNIRPLQRYGAMSEARVDLVCVYDWISGFGLKPSTKDRSAMVNTQGESGCPNQATSFPPSEEDSDGSHSSLNIQQGSRSNVHCSSGSSPHLPQAILDAISVPPPPTRWESPGNLSAEEAFVTVKRHTTSALYATWFNCFCYTHRMECPDCHLALGFLFRRCGRGEAASAQQREELAEHSADGGLAQEVGGGEGPTHGRKVESGGTVSTEPSSKREKKEPRHTTDAAQEHCDAEGEASNRGNCSGRTRDFFPNSFIGLELKRIHQRAWGLREFQERYAKSQNLDTFRALFPEAEELQSLYVRLTALRTQSELYNNLLRKHKEQNDVQSALLQSQKSRMLTYEEKLLTMQHIITTQRMQLDMQARQVKQQDDLLSSQRNQLNTLRQQMLVENMLLSEQSKTIESQREQIRVMKTHLGVQMIQERLSARRLQLEKELRSGDNGSSELCQNEEYKTQSSLQQQQAEENGEARQFSVCTDTSDSLQGSAKHSYGEHELQNSLLSGVFKRDLSSKLAHTGSSNCGSRRRISGPAPQWRNYVSTNACVDFTTSPAPISGESTPVKMQKHAHSSFSQPRCSGGAQYTSPHPNSPVRRVDSDAQRGVVVAPPSRPSNLHGNTRVTSTGNTHANEYIRGTCGNADSRSRISNLSYGRGSRLPPVHLRGVVATNMYAASVAASQGIYPREEHTTPGNHHPSEANDN